MRLDDPRDSNKRFFRASKRLLMLNGAWYFSTREGERGPFPSREAAEKELMLFTQEVNELQSFQKSREAESRDEKKPKAAPMTRAEPRRRRETKPLSLNPAPDLLI